MRQEWEPEDLIEVWTLLEEDQERLRNKSGANRLGFALLRIAQSALANTVRHAEATTAEVTLSYLGDHVAVDIVDDGRGFDPAHLPVPDPEAGGFGLAAMRARTQALGGTLAVESVPGHGTALAAQLPLDPTSDTPSHPAPEA